MLFSSGTLGRLSTIPTGTLANPSMYCSGHNNLPPLRLPREGKLIIPETFKLFPDISLRIHRGADLDETPRRPEPQVCDVAAALLRLAPDDRRAFIPSLMAMLKRVAADEERHLADRDLIAPLARTAAGRIGRLAR
jgi:hypothetical protein